jgi:hypothetical protein
MGVCPECQMAEVGKSWTITERWINTQGESACQALEGKGRKGLCKVFQPKRMRCRDSTKYARERMYRECCRGSTKYTTGPSDTRSQSYSVTDLQGPPSERTQSDKIRDLKSLAKQYARDRGSCDDTRISYLEYVESEAEADWTLARMIAG